MGTWLVKVMPRPGIEFVILDGEPGKRVARRQATIRRKVLQHIT